MNITLEEFTEIYYDSTGKKLGDYGPISRFGYSKVKDKDKYELIYLYKGRLASLVRAANEKKEDTPHIKNVESLINNLTTHKSHNIYMFYLNVDNGSIQVFMDIDHFKILGEDFLKKDADLT